MIYLRQKRQMKKGTFPLELKATRSVMHLWPLRSFFKGLRVNFFGEFCSNELSPYRKIDVPEEEGWQQPCACLHKPVSSLLHILSREP